MSRFLPKPQGLWRVDKAFPGQYGSAAEDAVMVSLCGSEAPWDGLLVEANPGTDYDWRRLLAFPVQVLVRPGIDATRTVKALMPWARPYVQVIDLTHWRCWAITGITPRLTGFEQRMVERPAAWK